MEDVLIHELATRIKDCWDNVITEPISYSDYIKHYVLPGKKSDPVLKKMRNLKLSGFIDYLRETNHPAYVPVNNTFQALRAKIHASTSVLFGSFYRLIQYLKHNHIEHSIVLRTFGKDLDRIIKEVHTHVSPDFFSWRGVFKDGKLELTSLRTGQVIILDTIAQIYHFLKTAGNIALQDDWKTWNQHGETQAYGKLFPIDLADSEVVSFFADDNGHPKDGILNPRNPNNNAILDVETLIARGNICVVDVLKAIGDDEYYVHRIKTLMNI